MLDAKVTTAEYGNNVDLSVDTWDTFKENQAVDAKLGPIDDSASSQKPCVVAASEVVPR